MMTKIYIDNISCCKDLFEFCLQRRKQISPIFVGGIKYISFFLFSFAKNIEENKVHLSYPLFRIHKEKESLVIRRIFLLGGYIGNIFELFFGTSSLTGLFNIQVTSTIARSDTNLG